MVNPENKFSSTTRIIFSLTEAAALLQLGVHELLHLGAIGTAIFFLKVPEDIDIFSIDPNTIEMENPFLDLAMRRLRRDSLQGNEPFMVGAVKYLKLEKCDCEALKLTGYFNKGVFSSGLIFDNSSFSVMRPPEKNNSTFGFSGEPSMFGRRFALYLKNRSGIYQSPRSENRVCPSFTLEDLYLLKLDMVSISEMLNKNDTAYPFFNIEIERNFSEKLQALCAAAKNIWSQESTIDGKYLSNSEVSGIIQREYGFSNRLAKGGAAIIRPDFACERNSGDNNVHAKIYTSDRLENLIKIAKTYWTNADINDPNTFVKKKNVVRDLIDNFGFLDYMADAGASIIMPNGIRRGRPAKEVE